MLTDTELILSAIKDTPKEVKKVKKKVLQEFGDDGLREFDSLSPNTKDALYKISRRIRRNENREKRKRRPVQEWSKIDFLVYTQNLLKPYNIQLENNGSYGADMMARLYDRLAVVMQHSMTNNVLKDYLQWWVLTFGPGVKSHSIYIQTFYDKKYIDRFLSRYNKPKVPARAIKEKHVEQDDVTIYKTGGLSMLLMSKGIVIASSFLRDRKESNIFTKISKTLRTFSSNVLRNTMDITINNAPYSQKEVIDFISVARPALEMHGLTKYLNIDYRQYFNEKKN